MFFHVGTRGLDRCSVYEAPSGFSEVTTTWDSSDKFNFDLTNGNLTSTKNVPGGDPRDYANVRTVKKDFSGKIYAEVLTVSQPSEIAFGIWTSTDSISQPWAIDVATQKYAIWFGSAGLGYRVGGGPVIVGDNPTPYAASDVVMIAVDFTAAKIWFGKNGTWNDQTPGNPGNPAAGTFEHINTVNSLSTWTLALRAENTITGNGAERTAYFCV